MIPSDHPARERALTIDADESKWRVSQHGGLVHERATVTGSAIVFRRAIIHGGEFHGGTFHGGTFYGGEFHRGTFLGGTIARSPILIYGSRYWIGWGGEVDGESIICSGCITRPVSWWLANVEQWAKDHGYSEAEQQEYRGHVESIVAWLKLYGLLKIKEQT